MRKLELIYKNSNMLPIVEYAARTCWQSHHLRGVNKTTEEYLQSLLAMGHESWVEHSCIIIRADLDYFNLSDIFDALMLTEQDDSEAATAANVIKGNNAYYIGLNIRGIRNIIKHADPNTTFYESLITDIVMQLPSAIFKDLVDYKNNYSVYDPYPMFNKEDKYGIISDVTDIYNKIRIILNDYKDLTLEGLKKIISFTFMVRMARDINEQFLRHRMSAYSKESLRYTDARNKYDYTFPGDMGNYNIKIHKSVLDKNFKPVKGEFEYFDISPNTLAELCGEVYTGLREGNKYNKEYARKVLLLATEGECVSTKTFSQMEHIYRLRLDNATQPDHREFILDIYDYMNMIKGSEGIIGKHEDSIKKWNKERK